MCVCGERLRRGDYSHPGFAGGKKMIWEATGDKTREKRKAGSQRSLSQAKDLHPILEAVGGQRNFNQR